MRAMFAPSMRCSFAIASILTCAMFAEYSLAQNDTLKVLFLGNSYTYSNELPQLFVDLSRSGGKEVIVDSNTPGGYTLEQHATNSTSLEKIAVGIWDYVILQEQSQIPTIDHWRYNSMYPAARLLDSLIHEHNEQTAFFMTWGRKYGGQQTIGGYSSPVFVDFFHMQDSLSSAYTEITSELSATLNPVGNAWATAFQMDSTVNLWQGDNSHPTLMGSYLAGCVFYGVFFEESPIGLEFTAGLPWEDAYFLQTAASQTLSVINPPQEYSPSRSSLLQNYPNPFNTATTIPYVLGSSSFVHLGVFDLLGREVKILVRGYQSAGSHNVSWNGTSDDGNEISSGMYFCRITAGDASISKMLLYIK